MASTTLEVKISVRTRGFWWGMFVLLTALSVLELKITLLNKFPFVVRLHTKARALCDRWSSRVMKKITKVETK
jgi:hypothetical protein